MAMASGLPVIVTEDAGSVATDGVEGCGASREVGR
jgi:hypothetical protein